MKAAKTMPALKKLRLFDSCVTLGRIVHPDVPECLTAEKLLGLMDKYEIAEALVHDHHARISCPCEHGNRRLMEAVRGISRLHPVWVLEPPKRDWQTAAAKQVEEMLAANVRAARLGLKRNPPMLWLWHDLLTELERHRVPCFLDFGGVTTAGDLSDNDVLGIREMAMAHPELPMIFSNVVGGLGIHNAIIPLIYRLPNLYIDITGVLDFWREVVRDAGPDRVLFASAMPFTDPGIYVSNVQYEESLDQKSKTLICGDNLRRLLERVK